MSQGRNSEDVNYSDRLEDELLETSKLFIEFLKDPSNKRRFHEFLIAHYQEMETEKVDLVISRLEHMNQVDQNGRTKFHEPSNLTSAIDDQLGMEKVENAMIEGLLFTKDKLIHQTIETTQEIKSNLNDISGVHQQVDPWYSKYIASFLQFQDPKKKYREMTILSVHIRKEELDSSWSSGDQIVSEAWDRSVATLAKILSESGLKTTYVKNDRQEKHLVMRQELISKRTTPDEYYAIRLEYETQEKIKTGVENFEKMKLFYKERVVAVQKKILKAEKSGNSIAVNQLNFELQKIRYEQDFFIGSVPDPSQLDEGLLLTVEVATTRDYHFVRNKIQVLITGFLETLVKDKQATAHHRSHRDDHSQDMIEYEVEERHLKPVRRKKSG